MGEPGFFKTTAIGGFDKKSVLNYIDTLNERMHAAEVEQEAKLSEYEKAQASQLAHIKNLESQLSDQESKLVVVAQELEKERAASQQSQQTIAQLEQKNQELQKKLSDNDRELQIQLERNRQLQFKAESLDYKSKKYDELSSQVGDALIEAKRNAELIVREANAKSSEIVAQAHGYMRNFYAELSSFKGDAARLRKSIEEILFVLNDRIDVMQEVVRQVETRFDADGAGLDYTAEESAQPFEQPEDKAGYLGGAADENMEH